MKKAIRLGCVILTAVLVGSALTAQQQKTVKLGTEAPAGTQKNSGASSQKSVESRPAKQRKVKPERRVLEQAWLGIETRQPTPEESKRIGLETRVRVIGQLVSKLVADGPAAKAGVRKGDVLLELDDMEIYSQDDIADFMAVSKPGQIVKLLLRRAENKKQESVKLQLGSKKVEVPSAPRMRWQYASLAQLDKAFAAAKKQGRRLLIGLSGAET